MAIIQVHTGKLVSYTETGQYLGGLGFDATRDYPSTIFGEYVPGSQTWIDMDGSDYGATIAVADDGTLWSCGNNPNGDLGQGISPDSTTQYGFAQIGTDTDWVKVFCGSPTNDLGMYWALKSNGDLYHWGTTTYPQTTSPTLLGTGMGGLKRVVVDGSGTAVFELEVSGVRSYKATVSDYFSNYVYYFPFGGLDWGTSYPGATLVDFTPTLANIDHLTTDNFRRWYAVDDSGVMWGDNGNGADPAGATLYQKANGVLIAIGGAANANVYYIKTDGSLYWIDAPDTYTTVNGGAVSIATGPFVYGNPNNQFDGHVVDADGNSYWLNDGTLTAVLDVGGKTVTKVIGLPNGNADTSFMAMEGTWTTDFTPPPDAPALADGDVLFEDDFTLHTAGALAGQVPLVYADYYASIWGTQPTYNGGSWQDRNADAASQIIDAGGLHTDTGVSAGFEQYLLVPVFLTPAALSIGVRITLKFKASDFTDNTQSPALRMSLQGKSSNTKFELFFDAALADSYYTDYTDYVNFDITRNAPVAVSNDVEYTITLDVDSTGRSTLKLNGVSLGPQADGMNEWYTGAISGNQFVEIGNRYNNGFDKFRWTYVKVEVKSTPAPLPALPYGDDFILDTYTGSGNLSNRDGEVGAHYSAPIRPGKPKLNGTGGLGGFTESTGSYTYTDVAVTAGDPAYSVTFTLSYPATPIDSAITVYVQSSGGASILASLGWLTIGLQVYTPTDGNQNNYQYTGVDAYYGTEIDVKLEFVPAGSRTTLNFYVNGSLLDQRFTIADGYTPGVQVSIETSELGSLLGLRAFCSGATDVPSLVDRLSVSEIVVEDGTTTLFHDTFTGAEAELAGHTAESGQTWALAPSGNLDLSDYVLNSGYVSATTQGAINGFFFSGNPTGTEDIFYETEFTLPSGYSDFEWDWYLNTGGVFGLGGYGDLYFYNSGDQLSIWRYYEDTTGTTMLDDGLDNLITLVPDTTYVVRHEFIEDRHRLITRLNGAIVLDSGTLVPQFPLPDYSGGYIYGDDTFHITRVEAAYATGGASPIDSVSSPTDSDPNILPTAFTIGARVDDSMRFVGSLDEIRIQIGGSSDITIPQGGEWPAPGDDDTGSDQAWVDITATKDDIQITKRFTLTRTRRGDSGPQTANVLIYKRSTITPTVPSADVTYTFADGTLSGLTNGWTQGIPAGTDPIWVTAASAYDSGTTDVIESHEWASPILYVSNGVRVATIFIFKRTATATLPSPPSGTLTYSFVTALLTGVGFDGWTQNVPDAAGGAYLYVTTATALTSSDTDTIATSEWADVRLMAKDGAAGAPGSTGPRGPVNIIWAITGSVWSDAEALAALLAGGYGPPQILDIVTEYNSATGFSETRFYDGVSWLVVTEYLNGNLFVNGTIGALKIVAGSIYTDRLQVGAVTAASVSATYGAVVTGQFGSTISTGVTNIMSFTGTGAPVTVFGQSHLKATSTNSGDGSGNGDARNFVVTVELLIDNVVQPASVASFSAFSHNLLGFQADHPSCEITMPVVWRGVPSAGAHTYQMRTSFYCISSNGDIIAQANAGASYQVDYYLIAQENKV